MSQSRFSRAIEALFGSTDKPEPKDQTKPKFESTESQNAERITPDSFSFGIRINATKSNACMAILVKADRESLAISDPFKTSSNANKRTAKVKSMMDDGNWLNDAKHYDIKQLSQTSFRIVRQRLDWTDGGSVTAYVVMMDYGRRSVDLNITKSYFDYLGSWQEEEALTFVKLLREAVAHVQGKPASTEKPQAEATEPKEQTPPTDDDPF